MQLQCPSCQKLLTVQDQNAGQRLRCPLCSAEFTAPSLPSGGSDPLPAAPAPTTYGLAEPEPAFTPPPPPPPATTPAFTNAPAEPAFAAAPTKTASAAKTTPSTPEGYSRTVSLAADTNILRWVPVGAVGVIFILLFFFSWVGVYPGGVPAVTQSGWQAAFGWRTQDKDIKEKFHIVTNREVEEAWKDRKEAVKEDPLRLLSEVGNEPGPSLLCLFYVLFFVPTFLLTVFFVVQPYLNIQLPPKVQLIVQQLLPWKWRILVLLHAILLLFLTFQLLLSFSLESSFTNWVNKMPAINKADLKSHEAKAQEVERGIYLSWLSRTWVVSVVWLVQFLAAAAAGLVYWMERRGPDKPPPALELRW